MTYLYWLWNNSRGIRWNTAIRIVMGAMQVVLGLVTVWLCKQFIDVTIHTGTDDDVVQMIIWLVLIVVVAVVMRQISFWMSSSAGVRQTNALRLRIFSCLFNRQLFVGEDLHSGDITSRLAKDIDAVSGTINDTIPQIVITMLQLLGAFLLMRWFDARLAWAILLITPLAIIFGKLIARRLREMTLIIRKDESNIQMQVQAITRLLMGFAFGLGYLLAFVWGGIGLRNGTITFGVMTSFLQLVGMIQQPIQQLLNMVPGVIHTTASIDRLRELESTPKTKERVRRQELSANGQKQTTSPYNDGILFNDVSFRYATGDKMILTHFTHHFATGSKTAIMGETGIGKTTMFRLILGFIEPSEGTLQVGGDIRFVPQGNTLMSGTIRYNLQLAKPEATDEEIRQALHTACADFVYELPDSIHTELGERGNGLSEGQAQRIAIARGLLHGGDIFLLDEISSSLDETTERQLFARLFEAYPQKTILFITHRSTVCELCDNVIRL